MRKGEARGEEIMNAPKHPADREVHLSSFESSVERTQNTEGSLFTSIAI